MASMRSVAFLLMCAACSASPRPSETVGPDAGEGFIPGAGGVRLFYRIEGGGPDTIVVLHGGPGLNLEGLRPDLAPLTARHALLYFDQRGSGRSEMPDTLRLTAALMVEDVEAVRRAFRLEQITLFGHSWGGGLAVLYAARYPERVRRMVLVGPMPPRQHTYYQQYDSVQAARRGTEETARMALLDSTRQVAQDPAPSCREMLRLFLRGVAATPQAASRIKGQLCFGTPTNMRSFDVVIRRVWSSLTGDSAGGEYDWRGLARGIQAPTLVVHGDADPLPLAGSEEWVQVLPNARLAVVPDAGHYVHAEQPEVFFPLVEAFLAGR